MDKSDFVIVFQDSPCIIFIYRTDADHSERSKFSSPQGAHAGAPVHVDPPAERPEYLLVPNCRNTFEISVDDPDSPRFPARSPIDITLRCWWQVRWFGPILERSLPRKRRTAKDVNLHRVRASASCARGPGTYLRESLAPSKYGITTRTTGI